MFINCKYFDLNVVQDGVIMTNIKDKGTCEREHIHTKSIVRLSIFRVKVLMRQSDVTLDVFLVSTVSVRPVALGALVGCSPSTSSVPDA